MCRRDKILLLNKYTLLKFVRCITLVFCVCILFICSFIHLFIHSFIHIFIFWRLDDFIETDFTTLLYYYYTVLYSTICTNIYCMYSRHSRRHTIYTFHPSYCGYSHTSTSLRGIDYFFPISGRHISFLYLQVLSIVFRLKFCFILLHFWNLFEALN